MSKMEISIPQSWDEVSLQKFGALQLLNVDDYQSNILYMVDVISLLADVDKDVVSGINLGNLNILSEEMSFLQTPIKKEKKETIIIDGITYKWKGDLNSLTLGELISIETVIDLEELSYQMSYDVICAVLLRKVDKDGNLEEFNAETFNEQRELFSKLPVTDVNGMILFFLRGEQDSMRHSEVCSPLNNKMTQKTSQKKKLSWRKK